jgi:hypothetical protein
MMVWQTIRHTDAFRTLPTHSCATNESVAQTFLSVPLLAQTGMSVPPIHMMR